MEDIKYCKGFNNIRFYNDQLEFRFSKEETEWQKLNINTEKFQSLHDSEKTEIEYLDYAGCYRGPAFLCFNKLNKLKSKCIEIKIKVYLFENIVAKKGGFGSIYFGYKLSGASQDLKDVVIKTPHNITKNPLFQEGVLLDRFFDGTKELRYIQKPFDLFTVAIDQIRMNDEQTKNYISALKSQVKYNQFVLERSSIQEFSIQYLIEENNKFINSTKNSGQTKNTTNLLDIGFQIQKTNKEIEETKQQINQIKQAPILPDRTTFLITKRYFEDIERHKTEFTLDQKINFFYQMLSAADTIMNRKSIALDIKLRNMVYEHVVNDKGKIVKSDEGKPRLELHFIDISPIAVEQIERSIASALFTPQNPALGTTPNCCHINDLIKLSRCCESPEKASTNASVYFEIGKEMMVYQIGIAFFRLLVGDSFDKCIQKKDLAQGKNLPRFGIALNNEAMAQRLICGFKEISSKNDPRMKKIESLLLQMVTTEKRICITEALKEVKIWINEKKLEKNFENQRPNKKHRIEDSLN